MRYLALITTINALVAAVFIALSNSLQGIPFSWFGLIFFTGMVVIFGLAGGLTLGLVGVLFVRWAASGALWALVVVGAALGAFAGWLIDTIDQKFWLIGLILGVLSALEWWYFVERHPERRAYFD